MSPEVNRRMHLEDENGRLKHIPTHLSLDKEMLQDVMKRQLGGLQPARQRDEAEKHSLR